jgi:ribosomal protein S19
MSRSLKKGPFVSNSLLEKIDAMNSSNVCDFSYVNLTNDGFSKFFDCLL